MRALNGRWRLAALTSAALALGAACSDDSRKVDPRDAGVPDAPAIKDGSAPDLAQPDQKATPDLSLPDLPRPDIDPCGPGTVFCAAQGKCVDTKTDNKNCGACGVACKASEICSAGKCAFLCPGTLSKCGTSTAPYCANLQSDNKNCGACGTACKSLELCSAGKCALQCVAGQTKCSAGGVDFCANLQSDNKNCGACGTACKATEACSAGKCAFTCPGALTKCGTSTAPYCANLQSDNKDCGQCGAACKATEVCSAGKCALQCPSGQSKCTSGGNDFCANLQSDNKNCGVCGTACKSWEVCAAGKCTVQCPSGQSKCTSGGIDFCANLQSDNKNCGACGTTCKSWEVCAAGKCVLPCAKGLTDCSGSCVDLLTDAKNCGKCGGACASTQICVKGKCGTATTCASLLAANPSAKSGTYTIQPSASVKPFSVYCDMAGHNGGWILFAKLGATVHPSKKTVPLTTDRGAASMANGNPPITTEYVNWDMKRFDSFGSTWTVRAMVDTGNNGKHYQYTFFRPASGQTVLPSTAGTNWLGTSTASKMLHLTMSTTTGLTNTTWLPVYSWNVCCGHTYMMFGYRQGSLNGQCMTPSGKTAKCHAPAGGIINENNSAIRGSYSAAFGHADGVTHAHGKRATYWIKEVNVGGTP